MDKNPDDLPNLPLLIKLLKMTASSNDGEALMACRKANEQLKKFGGDWESLLTGKVKIITNPFAGGAAAPDLSQVRRSSGPPPSPSAPPKPQPTPKQPPFQGYQRPQPQPAPAWQAGKPGGQARKPQPTPKSNVKPAAQAAPKKAPSFSNVDRIQLDDIV